MWLWVWRLEIVFLLALAPCGCIVPLDSRHADVIVHDDLLESTVYGVSVWNAAGAHIDWRIVSDCEDPTRTCVEVKRAWLPADIAGLTTVPTANDYIEIRVDSARQDDLIATREVMAHEIGHALGMSHVKDDTALMRSAGFGPWCIGRATAREWLDKYGGELYPDVCGGGNE